MCLWEWRLWSTCRQDSGLGRGHSWEGPGNPALPPLSVCLPASWADGAACHGFSICWSLSVHRSFSLPGSLEPRVLSLFFTLFREPYIPFSPSRHFTSTWAELCSAPQLSVLFLPLSSVLQLLFMLPRVSGMPLPHLLYPLGLTLNVTSSRDYVFHRIPWSFHCTFSYFIFFSTQWHGVRLLLCSL